MFASGLPGTEGNKILCASAGGGVKQHYFTNLVYKRKFFQLFAFFAQRKAKGWQKKQETKQKHWPWWR
jgi:hypothetical protein